MAHGVVCCKGAVERFRGAVECLSCQKKHLDFGVIDHVHVWLTLSINLPRTAFALTLKNN